MRAFPMPDMTTGTGTYKKKRIDLTLTGVSGALDNGNSVLMYPSGKLMRSNLELLGAASGVKIPSNQAETFRSSWSEPGDYGEVPFQPPKRTEELQI